MSDSPAVEEAASAPVPAEEPNKDEAPPAPEQQADSAPPSEPAPERQQEEVKQEEPKQETSEAVPTAVTKSEPKQETGEAASVPVAESEPKKNNAEAVPAPADEEKKVDEPPAPAVEEKKVDALPAPAPEPASKAAEPAPKATTAPHAAAAGTAAGKAAVTAASEITVPPALVALHDLPKHEQIRAKLNRALDVARRKDTKAQFQAAIQALQAKRNQPLAPQTAEFLYELAHDLYQRPEALEHVNLRRIDEAAAAVQQPVADTAAVDIDREVPPASCWQRCTSDTRAALPYSEGSKLEWAAQCGPLALINMLDFYDFDGKYTLRLKHYREPEHFSDSVFEYPDQGSVKLVFVGDWGAENDLRDRVLRGINKVVGGNTSPAVVIHLGDIYYCGHEEECQRFLDAYNSQFKQSRHPLFAVPGNHEYLAFGEGYFNIMLGHAPTAHRPTCGNDKQKHSFFSLEYPRLKLMVLGLDTSVGSWPDASKEGIDVTALLHDKEATWARKRLEHAEKMGYQVIIGTHHQLTSAYGEKVDFFDELAEQVLGSTSKVNVLAWFWGHEHRQVVFDHAVLKNTLPESAKYLDRIQHMECLGHGAIPVSPEAYAKPLFSYYREYLPKVHTVHGHKLAHNGFAVLEVTENKDGPATVRLTHYDTDGKPVGSPRYLPGFQKKAPK